MLLFPSHIERRPARGRLPCELVSIRSSPHWEAKYTPTSQRKTAKGEKERQQAIPLPAKPGHLRLCKRRLLLRSQPSRQSLTGSPELHRRLTYTRKRRTTHNHALLTHYACPQTHTSLRYLPVSFWLTARSKETRARGDVSSAAVGNQCSTAKPGPHLTCARASSFNPSCPFPPCALQLAKCLLTLSSSSLPQQITAMTLWSRTRPYAQRCTNPTPRMFAYFPTPSFPPLPCPHPLPHPTLHQNPTFHSPFRASLCNVFPSSPPINAPHSPAPDILGLSSTSRILSGWCFDSCLRLGGSLLGAFSDGRFARLSSLCMGKEYDEGSGLVRGNREEAAREDAFSEGKFARLSSLCMGGKV